MSNKTVVIFRWWHDGVIALFPEIPSDIQGIFCNSYTHVGQHGGANYQMIMCYSRPAVPDEYSELKHELGQIGYELEVYQRASRKMHQARHELARMTQNG